MDVRTMPSVGTVNREVAEQQKPGAQAQGFALGQSVIAYVKAHSGEWTRFVGRLIELSPEARKEFRKELNKWVKGLTEAVKASAPDGNVKNGDPVYRGTKASAIVRVSELTTISKALDAGLELAIKRNEMGVPVRTASHIVGEEGYLQPVDSFHAIVAQARVLLASNATGRGRPAKVFPDKVKKLALDHKWSGTPEENAAELVRAAALLQAMAETILRGKAEAKK